MAAVTRPPIRVLVVDDDALVRSGLTMILGGAPDMEVVAEAVDGRDGITAARRHRPDVVLMDIRMPLMDGLEATEHLGSWESPPRVIVLTTFDADDYVARALGAGASGFLLKDTAPAAIIEAIRRVADGDPMLSPSVTARLIAQLRSGAPDRTRLARARLTRLTEREHEVAVTIGEGLSNAEIAARLHLSVPTVKAHVGRLFAKLEVDNRVQIAICVHDAGLS
ncbi:response regulator transcription factor [Nocardioides panacis]|uniref:Response regulator transcription factor n=1 Tax=Nocardioides panacis TaxID=2849501 RepID=A0A975XZP4_9ACTN|nr:response regulator transcription factor [Nocardioides panacis]QWZ07625.1 response regulator transcription factor [Nocardioides panacis]